MNLFNYLNRQKRWSAETFGRAPRTEGILKHISKELEEVRAKPKDLEEWIDIVILGLDGAWRSGATPYEICQMLERKQAINMDREWNVPDSEDEPVEHVRTDQAERDRQRGIGIGIEREQAVKAARWLRDTKGWTIGSCADAGAWPVAGDWFDDDELIELAKKEGWEE